MHGLSVEVYICACGLSVEVYICACGLSVEVYICACVDINMCRCEDESQQQQYPAKAIGRKIGR